MTARILQNFRGFELDPRDMKTTVSTEKHEVTLVVASTAGYYVKAIE